MSIKPRHYQIGFSLLEEKATKQFGGSLLTSHPKTKRPVTTKRAMHLVLWSAVAKGPLSFLKKARDIEGLILSQGQAHGVKIYRQANGGNHLHLVVLPSSRGAFNRFIRSITGLIARLVLGAERGSARSLKLWSKRPFTRIVEWGRDFKGVCSYLMQNTLEARGFIPYQPRRNRYRESTA